MDEQKFRIGAYCLAAYASTEQHVKDLARCGIDLVVNMRNDRQALDLLEKHGVKPLSAVLFPDGLVEMAAMQAPWRKVRRGCKKL